MSEPKLPTCHWARDLHGETEVWTKEDMQAFYAQARADTLAELVPVAWLIETELQNGERTKSALIGRMKDIRDCCDFGEPQPLALIPKA